MMSLVTFDNVDIISQTPISHDFRTESGNNEVTKNHYYTVSGNGFVVVTASVETTGGTSDYGTSRIYIYCNDVLITFGYDRLAVANTENQGGGASATIPVTDGDVIHVQAYQSKNGAKTFRYYCLAVGCTVTYS